MPAGIETFAGRRHGGFAGSFREAEAAVRAEGRGRKKIPKHVMTEKGSRLSVVRFFDRREQCKDCVLYLLSQGLPNESPGQKYSEISAGGGGEISGFGCETGKTYALQETTAPKRIVTATVAVRGREIFSFR